MARHDAAVSPTTVRALLVDRDADTRQMYGEYLSQLTYGIDEAEDGREALAKAISLRPTVIVTETWLPGISGLELCRLLRNDASTRAIPIIVMTGDAFPSDVKLAEAADADAVLIKPCVPEQLAAEIRRVLSASHERHERARAAREKAAEPLANANETAAPSNAKERRVMLSRVHERRDTSDPPIPPPMLVCPTCDQPLQYVKSHIGGVSERHSEQWDYFECFTCQGTFEYRSCTRRMRACPSSAPHTLRAGR